MSGIPTTSSHLGDRLETVLAAAAAILTAAGLTPPPGIIMHGPPVGACDTLVVTAGPLTLSDAPFAPKANAIRKHVVRQAVINVWYFKCVPTLENAAADEITAASLELAEAGWVLWRGFVQEVLAGTLVSDVQCEQLLVGSATPQFTGGVGSWSIPITMTL